VFDPQAKGYFLVKGANSLHILCRKILKPPPERDLDPVADPLDLAIAKALTEDIFTDEVNAPSTK
jgi:hypothetical protein